MSITPLCNTQDWHNSIYRKTTSIFIKQVNVRWTITISLENRAEIKYGCFIKSSGIFVTVQFQQGNKLQVHLRCTGQAAKNILCLKFVPNNKNHHVSILPSPSLIRPVSQQHELASSSAVHSIRMSCGTRTARHIFIQLCYQQTGSMIHLPMIVTI